MKLLDPNYFNIVPGPPSNIRFILNPKTYVNWNQKNKCDVRNLELVSIKYSLVRVCQPKVEIGLSWIWIKIIQFEFDSILVWINDLDLLFKFVIYWQNDVILSNNWQNNIVLIIF